MMPRTPTIALTIAKVPRMALCDGQVTVVGSEDVTDHSHGM